MDIEWILSFLLCTYFSLISAQQSGAGRCQHGFFQCRTGSCLPPTYQCDSLFDCGPNDVSDELNCGDNGCASVESIYGCLQGFQRINPGGAHEWGHINFTSLFRVDDTTTVGEICAVYRNFSTCASPYLSTTGCAKYNPLTRSVRSLYDFICAEQSEKYRLATTACLKSLKSDAQTIHKCLQAVDNDQSIREGSISPSCLAVKEMSSFTRCAESTIASHCGPDATQLLQSIQQRVINDTNGDCHNGQANDQTNGHSTGTTNGQSNGHTNGQNNGDVQVTVVNNTDCSGSQQQKYGECQNILDQLTSHLEFFHFSYPFAPTDSYNNFTETCGVYDSYRLCMESVRSCYAQDSSFLFMKVTVGVMCDSETSQSIGKEIQNGPTSCIRSTSSANAMQLCLSNYSSTFDANINEITVSAEPTAPFCRILNSLSTFASCAEPLLTSSCGPTAHKITQAFSDYAFSANLHNGCKKEPEGFSVATGTKATFQVNNTASLQDAGDCTSLQNNLLLTCFAPFSSGFIHNLSGVDFDSMPLQKRTAMLSQVCSAYLIYNQCVDAVMGPEGHCRSKSVRRQTNNSTLDADEIEKVLKPICTQKLMAPSEQSCFDQLPSLPITTECSMSHGHHVFRVFAEKAPDFTFGDPQSCYLSQGLIAVTQCLEQSANSTCNSPAIRSALNAHSHVYAATFAKCNSPVDNTVDLAASQGSLCSTAQEEQLQLCYRLFQPFYEGIIGDTEESRVSEEKASEWCSYQFLYRHCFAAATADGHCHSGNDTIAQGDYKFSTICENRRGSAHNRNLTKVCPYDIDMDQGMWDCVTPAKSSFKKAAQSGFKLQFPAACNSIRDLGLMENCMKPRIVTQCSQQFGQYVDKHIRSLRGTTECSPGSQKTTETSKGSEFASNIDVQSTSTTTESTTTSTKAHPKTTTTTAGNVSTAGWPVCDDSETLICAAGFQSVSERFKDADGMGAALLKMPLNETDVKEICNLFVEYDTCVVETEKEVKCRAHGGLHSFIVSFRRLLCQSGFKAEVQKNEECVRSLTKNPLFKICSFALGQTLGKNFDNVIKGHHDALCNILQGTQTFMDCGLPPTELVCGSKLDLVRSDFEKIFKAGANESNCTITSEIVRISPSVPLVQIQRRPADPILVPSTTENQHQEGSKHPEIIGYTVASSTIGTPEVFQTHVATVAETPVLPTTTNDVGMKKHFVELRLPEEKWDESLSNAKSQKGQQYADKISQALNEMLSKKLSGVKNVEVLGFSQGSVRVKVQINAEGHNATEVQDALNELIANNGGRIGDYSVDPSSTEVVQAIEGEISYGVDCSNDVKRLGEFCLSPFHSFPQDMSAVFKGGFSKIRGNIRKVLNKTCGSYDHYQQCMPESSCHVTSCLLRFIQTTCDKREAIDSHWQCVLGLIRNQNVLQCILRQLNNQQTANDNDNPLAAFSDPQKLKAKLPGLLNCIEDPLKQTCGKEAWDTLNSLTSYAFKSNNNTEDCRVSFTNSTQSGHPQPEPSSNKTEINSVWRPGGNVTVVAQPEPEATGTTVVQTSNNPAVKVTLAPEPTPGQFGQQNHTESSPIAAAEPEPIAHVNISSSTPNVAAEPNSHANISAVAEPIGNQNETGKSTAEPQPEVVHVVNNTQIAAEPEPTGHPDGNNVTLKTVAPKKAGQPQPQSTSKANRTGQTEVVILAALMLAFLFCFVPGYGDFLTLCGCFAALIVTPTLMGMLLDWCGGDLTFGRRGGLFFGYQTARAT